MKIVFETNRFYLRESTKDDAELGYLLNLDPAVIKFTGDPPFASIDAARSFLASYDAFAKYGMGRWYIFYKKTHEFVGWCGLKYHPDTQEVDLGYRLLKKYWDQGIATETSLACIRYGFEVLGVKEIISRADKENVASIRVMEKIGMKFDRKIDFDNKIGVQYVIHKK